MLNALATAAVLATLSTGPAPTVTRTYTHPVCHPTYCTQRVTVVRPFLDTAQLVTVRVHHRPTNTRNSLPAPWSRWHTVYGYITAR